MNDTMFMKIPKDLKEYIRIEAKKQHTSMAHYIVMLIMKDKERSEKR